MSVDLIQQALAPNSRYVMGRRDNDVSGDIEQIEDIGGPAARLEKEVSMQATSVDNEQKRQVFEESTKPETDLRNTAAARQRRLERRAR